MTKYKLTPAQVLELRACYEEFEVPNSQQIKLNQIISVEREEDADVYSQNVLFFRRLVFMPDGSVLNAFGELLWHVHN